MILVINGPNLNLLGKREPGIYGQESLGDLEKHCQDWAKEFKTKAVCKQSNHEGEILDWLHAAKAEGFRGIVINPGAYGHSSIALRDAISSIDLPVIEVHISNIHAREEFRWHSYISAVCIGTIAGLGFFGYKAAIEKLASLDNIKASGKFV